MRPILGVERMAFGIFGTSAIDRAAHRASTQCAAPFRVTNIMTDRVIIVPYDPDWPRQFDEERRVLAAVFEGSDAVVEHVGSTAVPGLGAKPVIDIMVGVPALVEAEGRIPALEGAGYEYVPDYETQLPDRCYFRKPRLGPRAFHVHCVVTGSDSWVRYLTFRDHLRGHPDVAADYWRLKRELALRVSKDEYSEAKSPFVEGVLASD